MNILAQTEVVYNLVATRLAEGKPFTEARNAWQGYERLAALDGWDIGLDLTADKVLSLKATHRTAALQLPLLPIATRLGRGRYKVILDRASFDRWVGSIEAVALARREASAKVEADSYRASSEYRAALAVGDPEPWPEEKVSLEQLAGLPSDEEKAARDRRYAAALRPDRLNLHRNDRYEFTGQRHN